MRGDSRLPHRSPGAFAAYPVSAANGSLPPGAAYHQRLTSVFAFPGFDSSQFFATRINARLQRSFSVLDRLRGAVEDVERVPERCFYLRRQRVTYLSPGVGLPAKGSQACLGTERNRPRAITPMLFTLRTDWYGSPERPREIS